MFDLDAAVPGVSTFKPLPPHPDMQPASGSTYIQSLQSLSRFAGAQVQLQYTYAQLILGTAA